MKIASILIACAAVATVAVVAFAQGGGQAQPVAKQDASTGTINFETGLGSFRMIDGRGRTEFSFQGTVMISNLKNGRVQTAGNIRKEFEGKDRVAYFGTGRITVSGEWRAIQWFGRDLKGSWTGAGVMQMYGEFDRNLNTGQFWYEDREQAQFWGPYGITAMVPQQRLSGGAQPQIRRRN